MGYPFFIFKGRDSRDYNIIVNKLPPIHFLENEIEEIQVPGRDGVLTMDMGRREAMEKPFQITVYPDDHLQAIRRWLRGSGNITFSNEPDVFYKGRFESIKEVEGATKEKVVPLVFKCEPWGYLHRGQQKITMDTRNTIIYNEEEDSRPLIKIYGNGPVDLVINNDRTKVDVDGYVEIDSELRECYKDLVGVPIETKWSKMVLKSGENNITWYGSVSKVEVIPNWRI